MFRPLPGWCPPPSPANRYVLWGLVSGYVIPLGRHDGKFSSFKGLLTIRYADMVPVPCLYVLTNLYTSGMFIRSIHLDTVPLNR